MDTKHCAIDGWVDAIPTPGPRGTTNFDLIVQPEDIDTVTEDAPDTVITCTSKDPWTAYERLDRIQLGDLLRATGHPDPTVNARRVCPAHHRRPRACVEL